MEGSLSMNVDDIKEDVVPTNFTPASDRLDYIFRRQHELFEKYVEIEATNGLCYTKDCPVDIHDRFGQARLKDYFWRVTEELTEAIDAARVHGHIPNHTIEELSDALHFLVEAYLLAGFTAEYWQQPTDKLRYMVISAERGYATLEAAAYEVIHVIGCASNCLKQRPWKCTHQLVDIPKFRDLLGEALPALVACFVYCGLNEDEIITIYFKKSEVNNFRMRSNY